MQRHTSCACRPSSTAFAFSRADRCKSLFFLRAASCSFRPKFSLETAKNLCSALAFCRLERDEVSLNEDGRLGTTYHRGQIHDLRLQCFQVINFGLRHPLHAFICLRELIDFLVKRVDSLRNRGVNFAYEPYRRITDRVRLLDLQPQVLDLLRLLFAFTD